LSIHHSRKATSCPLQPFWLYAIITNPSLFLLSSNLPGQSAIVDLRGKSLLELQRLTYPQRSQSGNLSIGLRSFSWLSPKKQTSLPSLNQALLSPQAVPLVYSYEQLAFFCRIDVQLEKSVGLPVKFRLGEVQMVEQMERQRSSGTITPTTRNN